MALAARRQIIGGGAPVIKNWRRRSPQIDGGGAVRLAFRCREICRCRQS